MIDEPLGSAAVTDVTLSMGAGKLSVQPGATGLASGVIRYNVESWKPEVTRTDSALTIKQGSTKGLSGLGSDIVNDWDLKLGIAPIRLAVTAGAYEGTYELGGLSLQRLSIKDGASKSQVSFSAPNPSQMESLTYETGASSVTLTGLGDANFKKMDVQGRRGLVHPRLLRDSCGATVRSSIEAGVGSVHIIVPAGTAAKVIVKGKLTNVTQEGAWVTAGKHVQHPGRRCRQAGQAPHHHREHERGEPDASPPSEPRMSGSAESPAVWLEGVRIRGDEFPDRGIYPFNVPAFQQRQELRLTENVAFLVGENGSGKSTLIEAIARRCGFHIWAQPKRSRPGRQRAAGRRRPLGRLSDYVDVYPGPRAR